MRSRPQVLRILLNKERNRQQGEAEQVNLGSRFQPRPMTALIKPLLACLTSRLALNGHLIIAPCNINLDHNQMLRNFTALRKLFFAAPKSPFLSDFQARELIKQPNQLRELIIEQISELGELKVPSYWQQALTDEKWGYYRQQNVFSKQGDFTTSPEISSLFGEMIATWLVVFLQNPALGCVNPLSNAVEKKFRLVELGGGRGMLMQDILRAFHSYKVDNHFDLSFIEISDYNRKEQQRAVLQEFKKAKSFFRFDFQHATELKEQFLPENEFKDIRLTWYSRLQDLLREDYELKKAGKDVPVTVFLMNEFFDALPVTILEYTEQGWREKVLRLSQNPDFPLQLANSSTPPHQKLTPQVENPQIGDRVEISPESLVTIDMMAKMMRYSGGAILNIDYGGNGPFSNSIRAIKNHKFVPEPHFWQIPGACDLSAHVPFSTLARYAEMTEGVQAFELIPQQFFLESMGIETRMETLCKVATKEKAQRLEGEVRRLISPEEMGETFKVQIISLKEYGEIYPHITLKQNVF